MEKLTIETLKEWAKQEFLRRSCSGSYRYYYGKKEVIEFCLDTIGFIEGKFWELWNSKKSELKELGFGVFRDKGTWGPWILFCETKNIWDFMKEKCLHCESYENDNDYCKEFPKEQIEIAVWRCQKK